MKKKEDLEKENRILQQEIVEIEKVLNIQNCILTEKRKRIRKNLEAIKKFSTKLSISDHALVRFIERKTGINIEDLKKELLPQRVIDLIGESSDARITHNAITYVIKSHVIVTIE